MPSKKFWFAAILCSAALLFAMISFIAKRSSLPAPQSSAQLSATTLPTMGEAPSFAFTDASNKELSTQSLRGKVWLASFFFTSCKGPCPAIMAELSTLDERFGKNDAFRMVSISVDPENDSIAALAEYSARLKISPSWSLLRGPKEEVLNLLNVGFRLGANEGQLLTHSTRIVLVDRQGMIRGFFDGMDKEHVKRLGFAVQALL